MMNYGEISLTNILEKYYNSQEITKRDIPMLGCMPTKNWERLKDL